MAGVTMFMLSLPLPRLRKMCPSNTRLRREVGVQDRREVARGKEGVNTRRQGVYTVDHFINNDDTTIISCPEQL